MKDILVVYFSRSGYTQRVAEHIARIVRADCEAIRETTSRRGPRGYWRSASEALRGAAIEIEPLSVRPQDYSLVVVGTPVWAGNVSSPVRAFIAAHRAQMQRVALFCTQGGTGASRVLQRMADLCGRPAVATASFNDVDIDSGEYLAPIAAFSAAIAAASHGQPIAQLSAGRAA
jgi:flavodoxin